MPYFFYPLGEDKKNKAHFYFRLYFFPISQFYIFGVREIMGSPIGFKLVKLAWAFFICSL